MDIAFIQSDPLGSPQIPIMANYLVSIPRKNTLTPIGRP